MWLVDRPGTFWRRDRFELWGTEKLSVVHCDRVVLTILKPKYPEFAEKIGALDSNGTGPQKPPALFVLNCHLKAGFTNARRRLQQSFKALDAARKQVDKMGDAVGKIAVIVCGDFNSGGRTAVRELLTTGEIHKEYREYDDGANTVSLSATCLLLCSLWCACVCVCVCLH